MDYCRDGLDGDKYRAKCCPDGLCHAVSVCKALSNYVYFSEGRLTSGSLRMNGELISPAETSQSLLIYSPPLQ